MLHSQTQRSRVKSHNRAGKLSKTPQGITSRLYDPENQSQGIVFMRRLQLASYNHQNTMIKKGVTALIVLLISLATLTASQNWQASGQGHGGWYGSIGDNQAPNIPKVRQDIDTAITAGGTASAIATVLSDSFNSYWDQAWNVVVLTTNGNLAVDAVLYAYAYLKHWFWQNGYRDHCIIIWKQWQGQEWRTYESTTDPDASDSTESDRLINDITSPITSQFPVMPNAWLFAESVKQGFESYQEGLGNTRYSVVCHPKDPSITGLGARFKVITGRNYFYREVQTQAREAPSYSMMIFAFDSELLSHS